MIKDKIKKVWLYVLMHILLIAPVFAANEDLGSLLDSSLGSINVNILEIYVKYWSLVDFIIYLVIFINLSKLVFSTMMKDHQQKNALPTIFAIMLALGASVYGYQVNWKLLEFVSSFAVAVVVLLLAFFVYNWIKTFSGNRVILGHVAYIVAFAVVSSYANKWGNTGSIWDNVLNYALAFGKWGAIFCGIAVIVNLLRMLGSGRNRTPGGGGLGPGPHFPPFGSIGWPSSPPTTNPPTTNPPTGAPTPGGSPTGSAGWPTSGSPTGSGPSTGGYPSGSRTGTVPFNPRGPQTSGSARDLAQIENQIEARKGQHRATENAEAGAERAVERTEADARAALNQTEAIAEHSVRPELDSLERDLFSLVQEEGRAFDMRRGIEDRTRLLSQVLRQYPANDPRIVQLNQQLESLKLAYQGALNEIRKRQDVAHKELWQLARDERLEMAQLKRAGNDINLEGRQLRTEFMRGEAERGLIQRDVNDLNVAIRDAQRIKNEPEIRRLKYLMARKNRDLKIQAQIDASIKNGILLDGQEQNEMRQLAVAQQHKQQILNGLENCMRNGNDTESLRYIRELRPVEEQVMNLYRKIKGYESNAMVRTRERKAAEHAETVNEWTE